MPAKKPEFLDVDPGTLHVPPSRHQGADPVKLVRQIALFGKSTMGMPPLEVIRGLNGALRIHDGVTRATRVAKLLPGQAVRVEVTHTYPNLDVAKFPTIGDLLP
jgi:hypothetical protein